jgi:hypothetical protein
MPEAKFGGVTVRFNEDGTLFIYQPDSNRVLGRELAEELTTWLSHAIDYPLPQGGTEMVLFDSDEDMSQFTTLAEAAEEFGVDLEALASEPDDDGLTDTEREADLQASIARGVAEAEAGNVRELPEVTAPAKRRNRRNG